jgi:hypothetical protein
MAQDMIVFGQQARDMITENPTTSNQAFSLVLVQSRHW